MSERERETKIVEMDQIESNNGSNERKERESYNEIDGKKRSNREEEEKFV